MARPPARFHPFHTIRKVLLEVDGDGSQEHFARVLGNDRATITIKRIESGALKFSKNMAAALAAATGIDPSPLLHEHLDEPVTLDGNLFTAASLAAWRFELDARYAEQLAGEMAARVTKLILLAFREGSQSTLRRTFCELAGIVGTKRDEILSLSSDHHDAEGFFPGIMTLDAVSEEARRPRSRQSFEQLIHAAQEADLDSSPGRKRSKPKGSNHSNQRA